MTKTIKHFRLKIKTKTKSKMPAKINTAAMRIREGVTVVLYLWEREKIYKSATFVCDFKFTDTHVWLFSTTTNSAVTDAQLFCTKNTFIKFLRHQRVKNCAIITPTNTTHYIH